MGYHHGLDATQPPGEQAQEVVLAVCVQCEAEGPLRRCWGWSVAGVVPGQSGSRRWSRASGRERSGHCSPGGERAERERGEW